MKWKSFWEKIGNWELWPFKLRYFLISPVWVWYCIRSGSPWFFTSSNPTLTFGGLDGEAKREMYDLLPREFLQETSFDVLRSEMSAVLEDMWKYARGRDG